MNNILLDIVKEQGVVNIINSYIDNPKEELHNELDGYVCYKDHSIRVKDNNNFVVKAMCSVCHDYKMIIKHNDRGDNFYHEDVFVKISESVKCKCSLDIFVNGLSF